MEQILQCILTDNFPYSYDFFVFAKLEASTFWRKIKSYDHGTFRFMYWILVIQRGAWLYTLSTVYWGWFPATNYDLTVMEGRVEKWCQIKVNMLRFVPMINVKKQNLLLLKLLPVHFSFLAYTLYHTIDITFIPEHRSQEVNLFSEIWNVYQLHRARGSFY